MRVGAGFKGKNKRGILTWSTKSCVSVADPGWEFSYVVGNETRWTYRFEPDSDGTQIIESFALRRGKDHPSPNPTTVCRLTRGQRG